MQPSDDLHLALDCDCKLYQVQKCSTGMKHCGSRSHMCDTLSGPCQCREPLGPNNVIEKNCPWLLLLELLSFLTSRQPKASLTGAWRVSSNDDDSFLVLTTLRREGMCLLARISVSFSTNGAAPPGLVLERRQWRRSWVACPSGVKGDQSLNQFTVSCDKPIAGVAIIDVLQQEAHWHRSLGLLAGRLQARSTVPSFTLFCLIQL